MSELKWTTEYPTQPSYYWIRNCRVKPSEWVSRKPDQYAGTRIVKADKEFVFFAYDDVLNLKEIQSAEWYGPIQPPE